jgi:polyhydroxybutyrate depolymerase
VTSAGNRIVALDVDGVVRTYVVHVPPTYDGSTPTAVVVMFHGGGGSASAAMWETG